MVCALRITGLPFVAAWDEPNATITEVGLCVIETPVEDLWGNTSLKRCAAIDVRKSESASGTLVRHGQSRGWVASEHAPRRYASEKLSWICCTPRSSTGSSFCTDALGCARKLN